MTIPEFSSGSGITIDPVARSEPSLVRFTTPYLEVEKQSISSLEHTVAQDLAQVSHAARRKPKSRDQPSHRAA
jgi:hypothetical protein